MSFAMDFVFPPMPPCSLAIVNQMQRFPVHRIYCVGRNYAEHAQEMGCTGREPPFFFLKPGDAALPAAAETTVDMPYPDLTADLHHEVELVAAIGKGGRHIPVADALQHLWGYAVGLDMTRRDLQTALKKQGRPWCIAKGFEASAPIGALTPIAQTLGVDNAAITLHVNGQLRQSGNTQDMIWKVAEIISHLSHAWTLRPGDLIMTGTPAGVGAVQRGDLLEARITGLQALSVRVV